MLALGLSVALLALSGSPPNTSSNCTIFQHGSAAYTFVTGINNKGQVVGAWANTGQPSHAFLRNPDGTFLPLLSPQGSDGFTPAGINNLGQIAGPSFLINPDGSYTEIPPAVAPPGHTYASTQFTGINDKGELAGTIVADLDQGHDGINLTFIRTADGKYNIIDQAPFGDPYPSLIPGPLNNLSTLVEHTRYTDGYLLPNGGTRVPLTYPGLPFDSGSPGGSTYTGGLNNLNVTAGSTHSDIASNLAFIRTLDGHFPEVICPEAGNAALTVTGMNDQNAVAGTFFGPVSPGVLGQLGFIVTPTGVSPGAHVSNQSWTFSPHTIGQTSGLGTIHVSSQGPADLNIAAVYISDSGRSTDRPSSFTITNSNCAPVPDGPPSLPVLPPGASCFVSFQFVPRYSRWQTAVLYIPSNAPDSPLAIQLGGTGIGSPLKLSNTSWHFASHPVGVTSGNAVVYAYNSGPAPVTFSNIEIVESGQTNFRLVSTTCGTLLAAYKTCSITFNFTPVTPGGHTGSLNLNDNSEHGPIQIPIYGDGR